MAYRDDSSPLRERHESLSKALEQVRAHSRVLAGEEAALEQELERVGARLRGGAVPNRRSRAFVVAMVGAGGSALLAIAAFARIMTSEIAPFEMHERSPPGQGALVLSAPAAPADLDDDEDLGYLRFEAPRGTRIYEGEELLGTTPLIRPMADGAHAVRFVPENGAPRTKLGIVRRHGISTVRFD